MLASSTIIIILVIIIIIMIITLGQDFPGPVSSLATAASCQFLFATSFSSRSPVNVEVPQGSNIFFSHFTHFLRQSYLLHGFYLYKINSPQIYPKPQASTVLQICLLLFHLHLDGHLLGTFNMSKTEFFFFLAQA